MADTVRTLAYLQNLFRDNQTAGSITPQDIRDLIVTVLGCQGGISAAGTTQGTATALTGRWHVVTTVAAGSGVVLPSGTFAVVSNRGANSLSVYPPAGAQIELLSVNAPFPLAPGQDLWVSADPGNLNQLYAVASLNLANLPTSLPSAAGVPWNNGGMLSIS